MIDLFREWDANGDGTITKKELRAAMPKLGIDVPKKVIDDLFDSWDPDGSGEVRRSALAPLHTAPLRRPPAACPQRAQARDLDLSMIPV